ncbi:hypothetical protein MAR_013265 [Mya arenaria]|uniref:Uncharacterized protein n=1 Tax=Mya arenaria TaxID=6604 RepID=A0ABY7G3F6_MYAAR|nr:hypothetical protein MAR_013265 [Mya arenaria]
MSVGHGHYGYFTELERDIFTYNPLSPDVGLEGNSCLWQIKDVVRGRRAPSGDPPEAIRPGSQLLQHAAAASRLFRYRRACAS